MPNQQLAEEKHKPIVRKFERRKVHPSFTNNIWDDDLVDMQLISLFDKGYRFLLCVIDIYSKYASAVLLKDSTTITSAFQNILDESSCKSNKVWVDEGN